MLNLIYIKVLSFAISIIDFQNKKKIIKFFKKKFELKKVNIVDIGAHLGETIEIFDKNLSINKIISFEANPQIFKLLENKIKTKKKILLINSGISDEYNKKKLKIFKETSSSTFNEINKNTEYYKRKKKFISFLNNKNDNEYDEIITEVRPLSSFKEFAELDTVHLLKIDTEGYELKVLKGINEKDLKKIKFIYFEHHYDLMIKKNYKYSEIRKFLNTNNFYLSFKIKMNFRKTFEYIYERSDK
tara:strand:+ start:468 stop:1199 length:732 start_codon:yes stop_codon:yes gene_type:complete